MDNKKNLFRLPTEQQLDVLQDMDHEMIIIPMSDEQLTSHEFEESKDLLLYLMNDPRTQKVLINDEEDRHRILTRRAELEDTPLTSAINAWILTLDQQQQLQYYQYMQYLFSKNILYKLFTDDTDFTVDGLRRLNHSVIVKKILNLSDLQQQEKENILACYKAFIFYLNNYSHGWFAHIIKDFSNTRKLPSSNAREEAPFDIFDWRTFIDVLYCINQRDSIIARCLMGGCARISEILNLTLTQIDWNKNSIKIREHDKAVTFNVLFMKELQEYIDCTTDQRKDSQYVFVTRSGKQVTRSRLNHSLAEASLKANVPKVTPDSLKFIWSDLIQSGTKEEVIMQSKKWKFYKNI